MLSPQETPKKKLRVATATLSGCFGCHMSILDLDENLFDLVELVEFDRSPFTDIKHCGTCDIGILEGSVCNAENVHVLREFRSHCRTLIALGACAVDGGLPTLRNGLDVREVLREVYFEMPGVVSNTIPNDVELPLLLDKVRPINEVVRVDYFIPGCPPSREAIFKFLMDLIAGRTPRLDYPQMRFD